MPTLYLLAGPTASGKTTYSIAFAKQHNCEILSCDASAFYQGMDIGTAKPSYKEQQQVKHWGIDILPPNAYFSIKDFVSYSQGVIADITKRGKDVCIVGGSGFYLKSFLAPVVDEIEASYEVKKQIDSLDQAEGLSGCLKLLKQLNHSLPDNFDSKNPLKVKKALERCLTTGKTLIELKNQFDRQPPPYSSYNKQVFLFSKPTELLRLSVRLRTQAMLERGLLSEVENLLQANLLQPLMPAAQAIGYRESIAYIKNPTNIKILENEITKNTYELIKKQSTWFRNQIKVDRYIY